jgi:uncharacterized protein YndB with AHSA1/START domain
VTGLTTAGLQRHRRSREAAFARLDALLATLAAHPTTLEHLKENDMSTTTGTNTLRLDVPAGVPWIDFTREFDAPVAAVFEAHRDPEKVKQWLGPRGYEMQIERWDFTSGGGYRYEHVTEHGTFGFRGVFHSVRENEFALQTFEFDGAPDQVALEFMWFEDLGDGRTRLRGRSIGSTVEGRDAMVASGMEHGMVEGYERLEELVTA